MKKIIENIKKHWIVNTGLTVLLIAILLALFISLTLWVNSLNLTAIDLTKEKIYSLSEESKNVVGTVSTDIKVYLLGYTQNAPTANLVNQYVKANNKIQCEIIENAESRPDLTSAYKLETTPAIILVSGEHSKTLYQSDLESYDYTTGESLDLSEQKLTNGIINVTTTNRPKVYFLTGHNEYGSDTYLQLLASYMQEEASEVKSLNILSEGKVPDDCSSLVISSPSKDFTDFEVEKITDYTNAGGKILWMNDINFTEDTYPNIQKILDLYGVSFGKGIVLEQDTNRMILQTPNYIIPTISSESEITRNLATDGAVLLINACRLNIADDTKLESLNVIANTLLKTTEKALFRTNLENTSSKKIEGDEEGVSILGAELTKKINDTTESKLIAFSNNQFATNVELKTGNQSIYPVDIYNNKDLVLNSLSQLNDRKDTISIRKNTQAITYTATQKQHNIIMAIIFILPAFVILLGLLLWQIRRRKR